MPLSLLCSSFPHPSPPIISPSLLLLPSLLPLHPHSVCMNIDVNYPLPENSCSICDFPQEWHTHAKEGIMEVSVCCAPEQELKSGEWSLWNCIFLSPTILRSNAVAQYGRSFMPRWGIEYILTTANYLAWVSADGADATLLWEVR